MDVLQLGASRIFLACVPLRITFIVVNGWIRFSLTWYSTWLYILKWLLCVYRKNCKKYWYKREYYQRINVIDDIWSPIEKVNSQKNNQNFTNKNRIWNIFIFQFQNITWLWGHSIWFYICPSFKCLAPSDHLRNFNALENPINFLSLVMYAMVMAIQIYSPCHYDDKFTSESATLLTSIYSSNWSEMSPYYRRLLY